MAESELNVDSLIARLLEGELPGVDTEPHAKSVDLDLP